MAGVENSRAKLFYILQILYRKSDNERGVTLKEIQDYLSVRGASAERKSIYRDIHILNECGYGIFKNGIKPVEYCVSDRQFDIAELRLLVDAIQSARFISESTTNTLTAKLESLTSERLAKMMQRQILFHGRPKTGNDDVSEITATIQDAMNEGVRIQFKYHDYLPSKSTQARRDGSIYRVSPYALVWNDDYYYVLGYYERREKISFFRIDRMRKVEKTEIPAMPKPKSLNISTLVEESFGMYSGNNESMDIAFTRDLINPVIDRFGDKTRIMSSNDTHFVAHVSASLSPVFFSWLFKFGDKVRIIRPASVVNQYKEMIESVLKTMTEDNR